MFPLKNPFRYFSIYQKYIGKRLYVVFGLTLLAAVTEGLGISLLLPMVTMLEKGQSHDHVAEQFTGEVSRLADFLQSLLTKLGVQDSMSGILIVFSLVFLLKGIIKFVEGGYGSHLQAHLMRKLRTRLFDAYATMDYSYYSQSNTGHFVNLIIGQILGFVDSFGSYKKFIAALIMLTAYFVFAFVISWPFAIMAVFAGSLILLVFRFLNRYVYKLSRKTAKENSRLNHFLVQTMQAFKYLTATAQIGPLRNNVLKSVCRLAAYQRNQGIAGAFTLSLQEPISVGVLVIIVVVQLTVLDASLAPIMVSLLLIYRGMGQIMRLQSGWQNMMRSVGSLEFVEQEFLRVAQHQQYNGDKILKPLCRSIELDGLSFAYNPQTGDVLKDIRLTIFANSTVAFVGGSGAGKSTLVDLITLMLRPTRGELKIDGIPHYEVELSSWRSQIGYVSQETVIFDDTIANNICLWRGDYNTDPEVRRDVEQAASRAFAQVFINELPKGFNSLVGDRGIQLSGGQRQRLFIARELYKNPCLLILDEATSALDSDSELVIKKSIDQLKGTTTVVIIAHRLSTIKNVDYIFVLDKGRIIEQGTYDELMAIRGGSFNHMILLQNL